MFFTRKAIFTQIFFSTPATLEKSVTRQQPTQFEPNQWSVLCTEYILYVYVYSTVVVLGPVLVAIFL
jgi:hypothetical protein